MINFSEHPWLSYQIQWGPIGNCKIFQDVLVLSRQAAASCHGYSVITDQIDVTGVKV